MRKVLKVFSVLIAATLIFTTGLFVGRDTTKTFDYSSVDHLYDALKSNFDGSLSKPQLLDGIKSGLVEAAGDSYTEYFNPKEAQEFNQQLSGSFTGIGAELGADDEGRIVVVAPLAGYPAAKAGLKPQDLIVGIDGQTTAGISVSDAVRKIRGPADTQVKLTIVRSNSQPFDITITRVKITLPSVETEVQDGIGYIKISQFTNQTTGLVNQAARDFRDQSVKGIVLDLRGNPGGYLDSAIAVSSFWLDSGKVVVTERRGGLVLSTKRSSGQHPFKGMPTVVLIDGGSASASEITAGALRDNNAATLVGSQTFGKGSVQKVEKLVDGGELKVTIARWYTPGGKNIDKQGLSPDIEVTISDEDQEDQEAARDPQKDKAYEILHAKI